MPWTRERLEEVVPKYLPAIPVPASKDFVIVYAADSAGKECWVAYQVHRDNFEEYDSAVGKWQLMEYEDTRALREEEKQVLRQ